MPLYDALPKQIIHRDPHPGNFLFDGDEFTGFIDFELTESNIRLFDPCYLGTGHLMEALGEEGKQEMWFELFQAILRGYDRKCILQQSE